MNKSEAVQIESSQKQHHEEIEHQSRLSFAVGQEEMGLFSLLKPRLFRDGNKWCVLLGENLQDGIAGFGETPLKAIFAWNEAWNAEVV